MREVRRAVAVGRQVPPQRIDLHPVGSARAAIHLQPNPAPQIAYVRFTVEPERVIDTGLPSESHE